MASAENKAKGKTKATQAKAASTATTARRGAKQTAARSNARSNARSKTSPAQDKPPAKDDEGSVPVTETTGQRRGNARNTHSAQQEARSITLTIPVDQVVTAATTVARLPLDAARKVAPTRANGLKGVPVYLGLGGLTVVGLVEWPVAAAAGAGYAALRRWGPLNPGRDA
jgi:hypothetical protein